MTSHKHAEMIKAKADNMELVVFCKDSYDDANKWQETSQMPFQEKFDYFLCLPKHKEACLHWLNGGMVQLINDTHNDWVDCGKDGGYPEWYAEKWMMNSKNKYRIKPRKEKRWILINKALNRVCNELYDYQPKNQNGWVSHEIEVEV